MCIMCVSFPHSKKKRECCSKFQLGLIFFPVRYKWRHWRDWAIFGRGEHHLLCSPFSICSILWLISYVGNCYFAFYVYFHMWTIWTMFLKLYGIYIIISGKIPDFLPVEKLTKQLCGLKFHMFFSDVTYTHIICASRYTYDKNFLPSLISEPTAGSLVLTIQEFH